MKHIRGIVLSTGNHHPVSHSKIVVTTKKDGPLRKIFGDASGHFSLEWDERPCTLTAHALGVESKPYSIDHPNEEVKIYLDVMSGVNSFGIFAARDCGDDQECKAPIAHKRYIVAIDANDYVESAMFTSPTADLTPFAPFKATLVNPTSGPAAIYATLSGRRWNDHHPGPFVTIEKDTVFQPEAPRESARVALQRPAVAPHRLSGDWAVIQANSKAIGFPAYATFIERVLCQHPDRHRLNAELFNDVGGVDHLGLLRKRRELTGAYGVGAYDLLRTATELFLLVNCRVAAAHPIDEDHPIDDYYPGTVPELTQLAKQFLGENAYIHNVINAAFPDYASPKNDAAGGVFCKGVLTSRATAPCLIELIWSYWMEEGMLVQSVNALGRRFQNIAAPGPRDPLSHFELDPLRGLNNILWGYLQDEHRRLTVPRRSQEYSHHYGLNLIGRATRSARPADPRGKFLESFHNLLHRSSQFYKEDNDTTVIADGFPLLNALKEVHLVLAQGAHNQFGDLPWTARVEMLIQQWIMARAETRDFLQSRAMVPYTEAWMPQVDTMKTLQGWTDVGVSHFRDLATYGEQLLLSIRWQNWNDINDEDVAKLWARFHRPHIQSYLHSYRAVTGVDLTNSDTIDYSIPAVHLKRRLEAQSVRVR